MASYLDRLKRGWNAFRDQEQEVAHPFREEYGSYGTSYSSRPFRARTSLTSERSIVVPIYNRIAVDVASTELRHVRLDDNDRYLEEINSKLNRCLTLEANIDEASRAFMHNVTYSMLDEGVIAIVPVDTTISRPKDDAPGGFDIETLRVGPILQWYPQHVRVKLWDDRYGRFDELVLPKRSIAIVENPFYAIMNDRGSLLQRLTRKLSMLDSIDEIVATGKLDLIMQLPYVIKSDARRAEADKRRADIESQLKDAQYGIAYVDGTERITQLNRPTENNLLKQVESLTSQVYGQLGITPEIMSGTADAKTMLNYTNRVIEPITAAIAQAMRRSFISKTAFTQRQSIEYFRDPFKLVPVDNIADIADKFTRNEIMSSNEIRAIVGLRPAKDPKADELRNSNISRAKDEPVPGADMPPEDNEENDQNGT